MTELLRKGTALENMKWPCSEKFMARNTKDERHSQMSFSYQ